MASFFLPPPLCFGPRFVIKKKIKEGEEMFSEVEVFLSRYGDGTERFTKKERALFFSFSLPESMRRPKAIKGGGRGEGRDSILSITK